MLSNYFCTKLNSNNNLDKSITRYFAVEIYDFSLIETRYDFKYVEYSRVE